MKKIIIVAVLYFFSIVPLLAQDKLKLEIKKEIEPHVYIDGKQYDYAIFDLLDQDKIASVLILKDKAALEKYDAPNGVILIKTKSGEKQDTDTPSSDSDPMVVINGKVSNRAALNLIPPDTIESINILKGQAAIDQYNAPNGVVLVLLKE